MDTIKQLNSFLPEIEKLLGQGELKRASILASLWKGYGAIIKTEFQKGPTRVIKFVAPPSQDKDQISYQRKINSFQKEQRWYSEPENHMVGQCRIPKCLASLRRGDQFVFVLENLQPSPYQLLTKNTRLSSNQIIAILKWLAHFHAHFLDRTPSSFSDRGGYWHLGTRRGEFKRLPNSYWQLASTRADELIESCTFKTIIHGDAKPGNFSFHTEGEYVVAFDFQWPGKGIGVQDLVIFLVSAFSLKDLEEVEKEVLNSYFELLEQALQTFRPSVHFTQLKEEWTQLYPVAWFDYLRFIKGWKPESERVGPYTQNRIEKALELLNGST